MRSLITGIDGFMGSYLSDALLAIGSEVFGLSLRASGTRGNAKVYKGNITDGKAVRGAVRRSKPNWVFHLAAQSNIPRSFEQPEETFEVNMQGSAHVFEAVRLWAPRAMIISVGSSAEYGASARQHIKESAPLRPSSPYAVSKVSQGAIASLYCSAYRMRVIHVRPFAVVGPGKVGDALSDFCRAVVKIERNHTRAPLPVGNLNVIRDFIDVRDCVRAMICIARKGRKGEIYNICNGVPVTLRHVVSLLRKHSHRKFRTAPRKARMRQIDDSRLVGSNAKLRSLGYRRTFELDETVRDTLEFWRSPTRQAG